MLNNQQTEQLLEQMKNEIATELGIEIHADMTARDAGKIGGQITQRLIALGEQKLMEMSTEQPVMYQQTREQNQIH